MPPVSTPDAVVAAFGRVANTIVSGAERDEVLTSIVASLRELVDGDVAALALRLPDGTLEVLAAEGLDAELYRGARFSPDGTEAGTVMETGETMVVGNVWEHYPNNPKLPSGNPGPAVFVPLTIDGPDGALAVMRLYGRKDFDDQEHKLIRAFTDQATAMLEGDLDRRRDVVMDRINDQSRIAEELNSSAVNELYNAGLTLSKLYNHSTDRVTKELVVRAIEVLDHTIKLIRQAVFGRDDDLAG
jgi:two-component system, NarL family, sensor histidine kinase DevS